MRHSSSAAFSASDVPQELIAAITADAERDAVRVARFLQKLCEGIEAANPVRGLGLAANWRTIFSARFLLELAAVLQILEWESDGLVLPEMGLPPAREKLREILLHVAESGGEATLHRTVTGIFVEHFAWSGRAEMGVNVLLDALDDEQLADKIANFLWEHRHDLEVNE